jgi:hypothetical protein
LAQRRFRLSFVRKKKLLHASVYVDATEIVRHLVGLKDVRVLSYARRGPVGEITVEQADPVPSYGSYSDPKATYTYNTTGAMASVTDWLSHTTDFTYDPDQDLTSIAYPNSTTDSITTDLTGEETDISLAPTAHPGTPAPIVRLNQEVAVTALMMTP